MRSIITISIFLLALAEASIFAQARAEKIPEDYTAAVILAYQKISSDFNPESDLSLQKFESHVEELEKSNARVLSLREILESYEQGKDLPHRSVAITIEGAYRSSVEAAEAFLIPREIPFTLFYAPDLLGKPDYISQEELIALSKLEYVELGLQPATLTHIVHHPDKEIFRVVNKSTHFHREIFNEQPRYFSYPYGEISEKFEYIVKQSGFKAGFGLQSGVAYAEAPRFRLPRFSMTENYGNIDRFKLITSALPLPAFDLEPADPLLESPTPTIGFSLPDTLAARAKTLSCFVSGQQEPDLEILGQRVEIRLKEAGTETKLRINCTMPAENPDTAETIPAWRWFGRLLLLPE